MLVIFKQTVCSDFLNIKNEIKFYDQFCSKPIQYAS